jgi:hypothetical protein
MVENCKSDKKILNYLLVLLEDMISLLNALNFSINLIQSRLINLKKFLENDLSKMSSSSTTVITQLLELLGKMKAYRDAKHTK